jgi:hypothetical protein
MNDFSNFVPLTAQGVVVMYLLNDFFCLCIFKGGLLAVKCGRKSDYGRSSVPTRIRECDGAFVAH